MFSNTGTVSFWFYIVFIIIALLAMIVGYLYIKKSEEPDKLSKMIDLFKYSIVSVGIATVTLIVSDLFKEREQDVKELEYFDKYVDDVKKVDGIAERYELSKYLSIVAPEGNLKTSWKLYYDTLIVEYRNYLQLKKEEKVLDTIKDPTPAQIIRKEQIIQITQQKEQPLVSYQKSATSDFRAAKYWEEKGLVSLLDRKVADAINAFTESENAYNHFHQVYEISQYLRFNRPSLEKENSDFWKVAYKTIGEKFASGMPDSLKSLILIQSR